MAEKYGLCNARDCGTEGQPGCYTLEERTTAVQCDDKLEYITDGNTCEDDKCGSLNEPPCDGGTLQNLRWNHLDLQLIVICTCASIRNYAGCQ